MRFQPPRCPRDDCPSLSSGHCRWCFKGRYLRACDGRFVQRFLCLECHRTFSTQTFRVDYRLKKPHLNHDLIGPFVSKVTHRQAARILGCTRKTIAHRLELLGSHCRDFHLQRLALARERGGLRGVFQLDELETFEHSRRLQPVTMPVLIERKSFFLVDLETAALPCRGRLSEEDRLRKMGRERKSTACGAAVRERRSRSASRLWPPIMRVPARCACTRIESRATGRFSPNDSDSASSTSGIRRRRSVTTRTGSSRSITRWR